MLTFEEYLKNIRLPELLKELNVPNIETLMEEARHFTQKEAENRDKIVLNYFGEDGVKRITDTIIQA
ncbi:hypothetical protein H5T51_04070, partial [Candidatus Bathyarchaeota archaeon]|nr:hypothetical protein [Candidatus Bathyarchaeota archaeon]